VEVVTYKSLDDLMDQNFSSLKYYNCQDLTHALMPMQYFIQVKVNFKKKNPILPFKKFLFLVLARNLMMLAHVITHSLLNYLSTGHLREVKNKGKFQTFSYKRSHGRLQEVPNIVI